MNGLQKDRADLEVIMAEEKKIVLGRTLGQRINQHIAGRNLAEMRIRACKELMQKYPKEGAVLKGVIDTWERVLAYHILTIDTCKDLRDDLDTPAANASVI